MAVFFENYGLDFFKEDDDALMGLIGYVAQEGKVKTGYYGDHYIMKTMGDMEIWLRTEKDEKGTLKVSGFDTHCAGPCLWKMRCSGMDLTVDGQSRLKRVLMFDGTENKDGLIPIEVINADILPAYLKGDEVNVQIVAHPLDINYYENEEEYSNSCPEDENGKKWMAAVGTLFPIAFLNNHSLENYEKNKKYESDAYVTFTATVKKLYHGSVEFNGEKIDTFIRCYADTDFGEIQFNHTLDQVSESMQDKIKVGSIISGVCVISGDVAVLDYNHGIIKDVENNLKLLQYSLVDGDPERLGAILAEDAVYESDRSGKRFVGKQAVIDRIKYIHEARIKKNEAKYHADIATIISTSDEELEYPINTRCITLRPEDKESYESIGFIELDDNNMITKIKFSTDSRYRFEIDRQAPEIFDNFEFPDNIANPMIAMAHFKGIIPDDLFEDAVMESISDYSTLDSNARRMLDALEESPQPDAELALQNIFGYLFAKAIEETVNRRRGDVTKGTHLLASYCPDEAFAGKISSSLSEEEHEILENAMQEGAAFYDTVAFFMQVNNKPEEDFADIFCQAAVLLQRMGQIYADIIIE